jgi:NitT/TauT family transport system substrate-binding protein
VSVESLPSSSKTIEALMAGSVDFASTGVDHALHLAADGRRLRAVTLFTTRDARAIVASPAQPGIRSIQDLRGRNIGVPGLGSPNHLFVQHVLALHNLKPDDASFAGVGSGRTLIAALERGVVDAAAISGSDFFRWTKQHPNVPVLVETVTANGCRPVWGSDSLPFMALWSRPEWLESNAAQSRSVARALVRTLQWFEERTPEEICARLPEEFLIGDPAIDQEAWRQMKEILSRDGRMPADGPALVWNALSRTQEKIRNAKIDIPSLYTKEFLENGK